MFDALKSVVVSGHEWAKRQAVKAGIGFEALDNGFLSCDDPKRLQRICDSLSPEKIDAFVRECGGGVGWVVSDGLCKQAGRYLTGEH